MGREEDRVAAEQGDARALFGVAVLTVFSLYVALALDVGWGAAAAVLGVLVVAVVLGMVALAHSGWFGLEP